jgi:rare lipoprotein A
MRLPDEARFAAISRGLLTLSLATGLAACGTAGAGTEPVSASAVPIAQRTNAPRADYPVLVGEPYSIDGVEHVPVDTLNYDQIGYLAAEDGAPGFSGAHHTLPLPSYVEVTSLESGRTVLVRLERRGPMDSNDLIALSPAALAQLGGSAQTPVRVRRVNPPEEHRFLLRAGEAASLRMDTPASLLTVLQRRLPASIAAPLRNAEAEQAAQSASPAVESEIETVALAASEVAAAPALEAEPAQSLVASTIAEPNEGAALVLSPLEIATAEPTLVVAEAAAPAPSAQAGFMVQAAAFSTLERARNAAGAAVFPRAHGSVSYPWRSRGLARQCPQCRL